MNDRLHAALMFGVALLGYVGWALYATTDLFVNTDDPFWNRYEDTFMAADLLMCTAFLVASVLLLRRDVRAVPFGVAASGGLLFLFSLDLLFNLRNGHYRTLTPVMVFEVFINLLCLAFGPFTIVRLWKRRSELEGTIRPPRPRVAAADQASWSVPLEPVSQDEVACNRREVEENGVTRRVVWFFQFCTRINMGLTGSFGVLFVALPLATLAFLGISMDSGAVLMLQAYGCSLIFLAVLCYWFRTAQSRLVVSGLAAGNCVEDALLAILLGVHTFQGHINFLGWIFTVLFALEVLVHAIMLAGLPRRSLEAEHGRPTSPSLSTIACCHEGSTP